GLCLPVAQLVPVFIGLSAGGEFAGVTEFFEGFSRHTNLFRVPMFVLFCADPPDALGGIHGPAVSGLAAAAVCLWFHMKRRDSFAASKPFFQVKHGSSSHPISQIDNDSYL